MRAIALIFLEPDLFDTYIAFDPSLWWNRGELVKGAPERLKAAGRPKVVYMANSSEPGLSELVSRLAQAFEHHADSSVTWQHVRMPDETHATIYHPAALQAFRRLFRPAQ